jgi:hypothetical protein
MLNVAGTDPYSFGEQWPTAAAWLTAVLGVTSAWDATCAPPEGAYFNNDTSFYSSAWAAAVLGGPVVDSVLYSAFSSLGEQGWAPTFLSDFGTDQPDLSAQGRLPGRGFVLGGATLAQRRFAPGPCPGGGNFSARGAGVGSYAGGAACATTGGPSTAPFGLAAPPGGAATATVTAYDGTPLPLGRAFAADGVPGSPKSPPAFRAWLSAFADVPTSLCREAGFLLDAGWVDASTGAVELAFAVLNPELGRVAHVRMATVASAGGLWTHEWRAQSVLLAPYGAPLAPGLTIALDVLVCAYFAYLVLSVCKRGARGCILAAGDARARQGSRGACPNPCLLAAALPARLPPLAVAVDWFAVAAIAATIGAWATHCSDLAAFNAALGALPRLTPTLSDGAVDPALWAPGPGAAPAAPGGPPPWAAVEALAGVAVDSYVAFQTAAVLALIGLTLRSLKYMTFQAHLAVLFNTLRSACSSMAHFALPLVTGLVMFGVWGMFSFGHLAAVWSNTRDTALSVMRFMMYDYDIAYFTYADGTGLYGLYWVLFMMGMTNIMLWLVRFGASLRPPPPLAAPPPRHLPPPPPFNSNPPTPRSGQFFASLFDSYSIEKSRLSQWPTFAAETTAFFASLPYLLPACVARLLPTARAPCCSGRHAEAVLGGCCFCRRGAGSLMRSVVTWNELIAACSGSGALRHQASITPECLTRALGLSPEAAALLVADVAAAAAAATALAAAAGGGLSAGAEEKLNAAASYYGMGLPQGPKLSEAALAKLRRSFPVLARAIEESEIERARLAGAFVENAGSGGGAEAAAAAAAVEGEEEDTFDRENPPVLRTLGRAAARLCCGCCSGGGGGGAPAENAVENPMLGAGAGSGAPPPAPPLVVSPFQAFDARAAPPLSAYEGSQFGPSGGAELAAAAAMRAAGGGGGGGGGDASTQAHHEEHVLAMFHAHASQRFGAPSTQSHSQQHLGAQSP